MVVSARFRWLVLFTVVSYIGGRVFSVLENGGSNLERGRAWWETSAALDTPQAYIHFNGDAYDGDADALQDTRREGGVRARGVVPIAEHDAGCTAVSVVDSAVRGENLYSWSVMNPSTIEDASSVEVVLVGDADQKGTRGMLGISYLLKRVWVHVRHLLSSEQRVKSDVFPEALGRFVVTGDEDDGVNGELLAFLGEHDHCLSPSFPALMTDMTVLNHPRALKLAGNTTKYQGRTLFVYSSALSHSDLQHCLNDQVMALLSLSLLGWDAQTQLVIVEDSESGATQLSVDGYTVESVCSSLWRYVSNLPVLHWHVFSSRPVFYQEAAFTSKASCSPVWDGRLLDCVPGGEFRTLLLPLNGGLGRRTECSHILYGRYGENSPIVNEAEFLYRLRALGDANGYDLGLVDTFDIDDLRLAMMSTDVFVSLPHASMTAITFLPPQSSVVELSNVQSSPFRVLSHVLQLEYRSIGVTRVDENRYMMDVDVVLDAITEMMGRCRKR